MLPKSHSPTPHSRDWTHQRIWKDTSQTAYISGLFLDGDHVLMSYGSSDIDARLLTLSFADLEGLFRKPFDCSSATVVDNGSGEAPQPLLAVGAGAGNASEEFRLHHLKQHRRTHHREGVRL